MEKLNEAIKEYKKGFEETPFDTKIWRNYVELLLQTNHLKECSEVSYKLLNVIEACPYYGNEFTWLNRILKILEVKIQKATNV